MRFIAAAVSAIALALAAPASADEMPSLRLSMAGPSAGMEQLQPDLAPRLALDPDLAGSGSGGERPEPALALVLGIIPGFGLGHFYAGARRQATTWLIIDLVLLGGSIIIWSAAGSPLNTLVWIGWIVERGFEGYFAFVAAGGSRYGTGPTRPEGALASLDPRSGASAGLAF